MGLFRARARGAISGGWFEGHCPPKPASSNRDSANGMMEKQGSGGKFGDTLQQSRNSWDSGRGVVAVNHRANDRGGPDQITRTRFADSAKDPLRNRSGYEPLAQRKALLRIAQCRSQQSDQRRLDPFEQTAQECQIALLLPCAWPPKAPCKVRLPSALSSDALNRV